MSSDGVRDTNPTSSGTGPSPEPWPAGILIVGPLPPPYNGMTVMTENVLACGLPFDVRHVDTSDHRDVSNVGRIDFVNVWLALLHIARVARGVLSPRVRVVYLPIAQNTLGYMRDVQMMALAHLTRKRLVVHLHGGSFGRFYADAGVLMRWVIRRSMRWVDAAIVLGECLRDQFKGLTPPERVFVVPNGIGPPSRTDASTAESAGAGSPTVLHLSTLMREKGCLDVLRAAAIVKGHLPNVKFVLAGPWWRNDEQRDAAELIEQDKLDGTVQLAGEVAGDEKEKLIAGSDLFVMPTYYPHEGQPLVILEAFSHGVPVIATAQGCIAETVSDGVDGKIVPPRDPQALADVIVALLKDPVELARLGCGARDAFEERHTLDVFSRNLTAVFEAVLKG